MNEGLSDTVSNEFVQILKQGETDNEKLFEKRDLNSLSASGLTKFNSEYIVDFRGIGIHPRFESSSFRIHDKIVTSM